MAIHTTPDSYTKFLVHSDTTNGSTTFVDSSATGHTVVTNGDPSHSTTQAKFGSTAIHCDDTADGFGAAASSEFELDDNDWTLDFWWYPTSIESENYFLHTTAGHSMLCLYYPSSGGFKIIHSNPSPWQTSVAGGAGTLSANRWYHIAFVRANHYHTIYVDGAIVAGPTEDTAALTNTTTTLVANSYMAGNFTGYVDEYRLSVGIARWTDSFVPPNKPYSVVDDDFVTDVAGIEDDGSGNTTFGRDIIVKSNPDEASTDTVFSVQDKVGTPLLEVRADGIVTRPNNPAFHAYIDSLTGPDSTHGTVTFNATSYNIGNHYNTSTSTFTAPVDGLYSFTLNVGLDGIVDSTLYFGFNFVVGGVHNMWQFIWENSKAQDYWSKCISREFQMDANDTCYVYLGGSGTGQFSSMRIAATDSTFSGHLIG